MGTVRKMFPYTVYLPSVSNPRGVVHITWLAYELMLVPLSGGNGMGGKDVLAKIEMRLWRVHPQDPGEHTWLGLGPRKQLVAVATLSSHAVLLADGPLFHLAKLSHPGRTHFHTHTLEGPCIVAHWVFRNPPYILEDGALNLLPWPLLLLAIITRALLVLPRADLSH